MIADRIPRVVKNILAYRRKKRVEFILLKVLVRDGMRVIDIGCGVDGRSFDDYVPNNWKITGIDMLHPEAIHHKHPNFSYICQKAEDLSRFKDGEFDLAISIGLFEHLTIDETFNPAVQEIRRVAKQYIVVVPFKYCWLEPHFAFPLFPVIPYSMKVFIVKMLNLNRHRDAVKEDPGYLRYNFRWRSNSEYKKAFPDAKIYLLPTFEMIAIIKKSNLS